MLVSVQSADRLNTVALPDVVGGAHWVSDASGSRLAFVEGSNGLWHVDPVEGCFIRGLADGTKRSVVIEPHSFTVVNIDGPHGATWCLVFQSSDESALETVTYGFEGDIHITVGRSDDNGIVYENGYVSNHHVNLLFRNGSWSIGDPGSTNGVFVNGRRIRTGVKISASYGDVVSLLGFRMTLGNGLFSCNNPGGCVSVTQREAVRYRTPKTSEATEKPRRGGGTRELFYPGLRFARAVEPKKFTVDAPPNQEKEEQTSLLQRVGPSMLMGFASLMSACVFIMMLGDQNSSWLRALPMVFMALSMLAASVVWPIVNERHKREERERRESLRQGAYSQYLSSVLSNIAKEERAQRAILEENRISVGDCLAMAACGDVHLMDRTTLHADFLEVRIGMGDEPLAADIKFPDAHFSIDDDELRKEVESQSRVPRVLNDVPLSFPLVEKHIAGVVGPDSATHAFVRGIVVQIAALCSYEDVKLVVLTDEAQREEWSFALHVPHCFSDDRTMRYFACGLEEASEVGMQFERVIAERKSEDRFDGREAHPYYVVICASELLVDASNAIEAIVGERANVGISLIAIARTMKDLPKECRSVIGLDGRSGYLLDRDNPSGERKGFVPDIAVTCAQAEEFAYNMAKLRLDLSVEKHQVPSRLGFLEMHGAGNVEHFNIASRWADNSASTSLACRVGVDAAGEPFLLNLHEKVHGPHGLIAGTTGSGKSEFIITYILSMAMSYSPDDVAFVLIDYKGGGLARAFDNEHVRLPHLAGVITNLDGAAINRSLVSIQSELKRRQALFNEARDVVGGDNVDIYDYLDLYRQGRMSEPCPHLFIVADEFAELKQQEPDFMDELISAARIGRSLGVHLVLATQKPTGVVNDQIWSNARFKVCLKVADAGDSKEMIRRPDAAELQEAGRFYLLVGYNEYFALGQSAYSGVRYVARDRFEQSHDESVVLISDTGRPLVTVKEHVEEDSGESRPESVVVLSAIQKAAEVAGVRARQLWLEPIPAIVALDALAAKYGRVVESPQTNFVLDPIIGEYDDPNRQRQGLLTLPLGEKGDAVMYGTPDSGVEVALYSMMCSLLRTHDARSLNVYAVDFGSESLRAFAHAPQVGDVIGADDEEKMKRFFDFFEGEFTRRRAVLAEYGGSFARYSRSHEDLPAVVVILNDVSAIVEAYSHIEDRLMKFAHETGRNGVYLVATAAGSSSIRMRMRQGFRQVLAINLADTTDYAMMFGPMHGIPLPKGFGRGLVQLEDGVFEFQAAHVAGGADEYGYAVRCCDEVAEQLGSQIAAPPIPSAPEAVSPEEVAAFEARDDFVPYGIYDDDLSVAGFDFADSPLARCQFQRRKDGAAFMRAFLESMAEREDWSVAVLDLSALLGEKRPPRSAFATRKPEAARSYLTNLMKAGDRAVRSGKVLVVISGITDFINRQGKNFETGEDFGGDFKAYLRGLPVDSKVAFVLFDASTDTSYTYEDWFKSHLTNKDGLWVGSGIESQSVIGVTFSTRFAPDAEMNAAKGYEVIGGATRLLHLACNLDEVHGLRRR